MDELLTIAPPPVRRIARISCFMHRNTPLALTFRTLSQSSASRSSASLSRISMPALLNAPSRRPNSATARPTIAATSASFETSASTAYATPPAPAIPLATSSTTAPMRPLTTTFAPAPARISDAARPIPEPAPVTMTTLPCSGDVPPVTVAPPGCARA